MRSRARRGSSGSLGEQLAPSQKAASISRTASWRVTRRSRDTLPRAPECRAEQGRASGQSRARLSACRVDSPSELRALFAARPRLASQKHPADGQQEHNPVLPVGLSSSPRDLHLPPRPCHRRWTPEARVRRRTRVRARARLFVCAAAGGVGRSYLEDHWSRVGRCLCSCSAREHQPQCEAMLLQSVAGVSLCLHRVAGEGETTGSIEGTEHASIARHAGRALCALVRRGTPFFCVHHDRAARKLRPHETAGSE